MIAPPPAAAKSAPKAGALMLNVARSGQTVVIRVVHAGRDMRGRLAALGLMNGVRVRVIRAGRRNPTVIGLQGARIVLGRGMAEKIEVSPASAETGLGLHE